MTLWSDIVFGHTAWSIANMVELGLSVGSDCTLWH